ncbi:MAG: GFA family protein [Alphaproteobacteria bacterium]
MSEKIEGGCLCGAVRDAAEAEPMFAVNCHCRHCQLTSGSTHIPGVGLPAAAFSITGDLTEFTITNDRGGRSMRAFCPTCGTPVYGQIVGEELVFLHAITLDDPSGFTPQMDIFADSAQPWDRFDDALPRFPQMPPMED